MDTNVSLKKNSSIVGAVVSLLAISVFYIPFASLSISFGDLLVGGRVYAVYEMFQNGTGQVIAIFGTFLLIANAILQFLKPKAWLNLLCSMFLLIPILLARSIDVQLLHKEFGWYLCLFFVITLFAVWAIGYVLYLKSVKSVKSVAIWGAALVVISIVLPLVVSYTFLPSLMVVLPIGLCLLITALLGRIFSNERAKSTVTDNAGSETPSSNDQKPTWEKFLWPCVCGVCLICAIAVFAFCFKEKQDKQEIPSELISEMEALNNDTDGEMNTPLEQPIDDAQAQEETEMSVEDDWDATTSVDWEGTINGKWKIEMNINRLDGLVWGSYFYTKNQRSISLNGQWGENDQLTLTESVDGNVTGQFIGSYGEDSFDGIWISADGEKEYPFSLKPIYKVEP